MRKRWVFGIGKICLCIPAKISLRNVRKLTSLGLTVRDITCGYARIKMPDNKHILVGKIVAPQGIRGEVRVQTFTEHPSDFKDLAVFGENIAAGAFHFVRPVPHSNVIIARIDGVADRNATETLRGTELFVNRDSLPSVKDGEYYQSDLIGMTVVRNGTELGHVECFQNFGAGDIMELDNGDMVAFRGATVDFHKNTIYVE